MTGWFGGPGASGASAETVLKGSVGLFIIGCAVRLLFARGDAQMIQVGSVLMFLGGVGALVAALVDRRDRKRLPPSAPPRTKPPH